MVIMIGLCLFWSRHDWNFSQLLLFEKLFSVRFPIVKEGAITGRKTNLPILTYLYFLYTNIHSKQNTLLTLFIKCIFNTIFVKELYLLGFYVLPRTEIIKLWKNEIHKVCSLWNARFSTLWKICPCVERALLPCLGDFQSSSWQIFLQKLPKYLVTFGAILKTFLRSKNCCTLSLGNFWKIGALFILTSGPTD